MIVDLIVPTLPDNVQDMVLPKVNAVSDIALGMSCRDILHQGYVDAYGEPTIDLLVTWHYASDPSANPELPLPVSGLDIELAPVDDQPGIINRLYPFRTHERTREEHSENIIQSLFLHHIRRLNPGRPMMALEDDELERIDIESAIKADEAQSQDEKRVILALLEFAIDEQEKRHGKENAHERLLREAAQQERRRQLSATHSQGAS